MFLVVALCGWLLMLGGRHRFHDMASLSAIRRDTCERLELKDWASAGMWKCKSAHWKEACSLSKSQCVIARVPPDSRRFREIHSESCERLGVLSTIAKFYAQRRVRRHKRRPPHRPNTKCGQFQLLLVNLCFGKARGMTPPPKELPIKRREQPALHLPRVANGIALGEQDPVGAR